MQYTIKTYDIYHDVFIEASKEEVYDAISKPEHLINWWPYKCKGEARLGAEYNFYFTPEYDWYGEVVQYDKTKSFHIKMTKSDADWDPTTFGFDLKSVSGGTQLHFWHKDWPVCNHHFRKSSWCWAMLLSYLKNYLEKGTVVPFNERE